MPIQPVTIQSGQHLEPYYYPELARTIAVNLAPGTYAQGQALGRFTQAATNEVQTLTATGTVSGGTYSLTIDGVTVGPFAHNASVATIQAAINAAFGAGQIAVGGGAFPGTPLTFTFTGVYAGTNVPTIAVTSAVTGGGSIAMAQTTAGAPGPGKYGAYADANSDGTGVFVGLLKYACTVLQDGTVQIGERPYAGASAMLTAPIYVAGYFHSSDVTGLDAAALADVGGHFIEGGLSGGVFVF